MSTVIELLLLGILAYVAAMIVRSTTRRRATKRSAKLAEFGSAEFPCQLSWETEVGKKSFVYGKVLAANEGLAFSRRRGGLVSLPRSDWVHRETSWRTGLVILRYTVPGKGDVRLLVSEADAELIEGFLSSK